MSGPKTSRYTLTPEQRAILEEQRKVRVELELMKKQTGDVRSVIADMDRLMNRIAPLFGESGMESGTLKAAKKLQDKAKAALSQAATAGDTDSSDKLKSINQSLEDAVQQLQAASKILKKEEQAADKAFRKKSASAIDGGFTLPFVSAADSPNPTQKKIQQTLEELEGLNLNPSQKEKAANLVKKYKEIASMDLLKSFYAMTVLPFARDCRRYHDAYEAQGAEYERLRFIYMSNAQQLGMAAQEIPFSEDAVVLLGQKVAQTEELLRQQQEQAYISRCVDEAMREMGYEMAGDREVVRRSGKRFRNKLYLFDEGTVVNVTYANDGRITMELGGVDTADRLPTEEESTSLVADMQTFCDDYLELERRLQKKGVCTNRVSILPANAQYAQIINVSDYNMTAKVSEYEARKIRSRIAETQRKKMGGNE